MYTATIHIFTRTRRIHWSLKRSNFNSGQMIYCKICLKWSAIVNQHQISKTFWRASPVPQTPTQIALAVVSYARIAPWAKNTWRWTNFNEFPLHPIQVLDKTCQEPGVVKSKFNGSPISEEFPNPKPIRTMYIDAGLLAIWLPLYLHSLKR